MDPHSSHLCCSSVNWIDNSWERHSTALSAFIGGRCRLGGCDLTGVPYPAPRSGGISPVPTSLISGDSVTFPARKGQSRDSRYGEGSEPPKTPSLPSQTPRRRKENTQDECSWSTHLFKKALPKAFSFLKGFLGSTTRAFPGMIPSTCPCITAMKESVVGSGPILMPGKSCSRRYLAEGSTVVTQGFCSQSKAACLPRAGGDASHGRGAGGQQ